ncbi:hypothetical protein ColLi_07320 [Colletotrichum liriopes]|uniref:Transmembrane protein n=1 Tax=Colletotrichum liriopes TaxID=708192 RepID=A0AA37GQ25_9PEZI|nr:hypothetical protein ColLi_07320 [Colletotrichum liriopes]
MKRHAIRLDDGDDTAFVSNAVFRLSQSGESFQTGGPVISRVSRVKTATVTITATEKTQVVILTSTSPSSSSPMDTFTITASSIPSAMLTLTATTLTTLTTKETTPQPTSTGLAPAAPHISVPVNTLIAIVAGTVGGLLLLAFVIAVVHAFVRRISMIHDETRDIGGASSTLEKGSLPSGQQQQCVNNSNVSNIGIPHLSPSAHSELGIAQQYQKTTFVPDADFRAWAAAHDVHPNQIIAELPAESNAGHSQQGHRG